MDLNARWVILVVVCCSGRCYSGKAFGLVMIIILFNIYGIFSIAALDIVSIGD